MQFFNIIIITLKNFLFHICFLCMEQNVRIATINLLLRLIMSDSRYFFIYPILISSRSKGKKLKVDTQRMESCIMMPFGSVARVRPRGYSPRQRIDEQGDDDHGDDHTSQINRRNFVDLRFWRTIQSLVGSVPEDAEVCSTELDFVPIRGTVPATTELFSGEYLEFKQIEKF